MTGEAKLPGHEFELRIPWWHITFYLFYLLCFLVIFHCTICHLFIHLTSISVIIYYVDHMNLLFPCDLPHTHALCMTQDLVRYVKMLPGSEKSTDGTFVPWNIRFLELSLLCCGTFVARERTFSGANVPRTFAPWNFRSFRRTNRLFQELSLQASKTIKAVDRLYTLQ